MAKLNIVVISRPDGWLDTHLRRFVFYAKSNVPEANLYLLLRVPKDFDYRALDKVSPFFVSSLSSDFKSIKIITDKEMPGYLIFNDWLRGGILDAFNLTEALYLDVDTDIIKSIYEIPELGKEDILWTPNKYTRKSVFTALDVYGIKHSPPYAEPSVMYLRRSFSDAYIKLVRDNKIDMNDYLPSVNIWNIIIRQCGSQRMLPYCYNTVSWDIPCIAEAKILHFAGSQAKAIRQYYDYSEMSTAIRLKLP